MDYFVSELEILYDRLEAKRSILGNAFFYSKKYNFRSKEQLAYDLQISDIYCDILSSIIQYNYNCYPSCSYSTCTITNDEEEEGTRTQTIIGKSGSKLRIKVCDTFGETTTCTYIYKDYVAKTNSCMCCDYNNLIKSITIFINS